MSLLNIGLQGLALERDHAGTFEPVIQSCKAMKSMRSKAIDQQGLKEAFQASIDAPIRTLECVFKMLELKAKRIKLFKPNRDMATILQALQNIDPNIKEEEDIPHAMSKLKNFTRLQNFLEKHLTDGLYLLQYRKCGDESCCTLRSRSLPPSIPAPVLGPDKEALLKV